MSETALLKAVRTKIRALDDFNNHEVDIEYDEMAHPTTGQKYVAIIPKGFRDGPAHQSSGGVVDRIYAFDIMVVVRMPATPRDRARDLFFAATTNLNSMIKTIDDIIDFQYSVLETANATILADESSSEGFIETQKGTSIDAKPQPVSSEFFAAKPGESRAGLKRTIHYDGARRITTRTQV